MSNSCGETSKNISRIDEIMAALVRQIICKSNQQFLLKNVSGRIACEKNLLMSVDRLRLEEINIMVWHYQSLPEPFLCCHVTEQQNRDTSILNLSLLLFRFRKEYSSPRCEITARRNTRCRQWNVHTNIYRRDQQWKQWLNRCHTEGKRMFRVSECIG